MGVEVVAGEDIVLARVVVVVAAALDGAGAHVVLEHDGDGILAPAVVLGAVVVLPGGLHAAAERLSEVAVGSRVLADRAAQAGPDDVRADIDLGPEVDAGARGAPGATGVAAGLLPKLRVEAGNQAVVVGDVVELVGIGRVHVRDAVGIVLLAPLLDGVNPRDGSGIVVRVGVCARDAGAHTFLEGSHGVVVERRRGTHEAVVPHERDDLLGGELVCQGLCTDVDRLAPVLVEVELAVAVRVAEGVAVDLDDLGLLHDTELGARVLVGHADPAVARGLGGPLGGGSLLVGIDGVLVGGGSGQRIFPGAALGSAARERRGKARRQRRACQEAPARDVAHVLLLLLVEWGRARPSSWFCEASRALAL